VLQSLLTEHYQNNENEKFNSNPEGHKNGHINDNSIQNDGIDNSDSCANIDDEVSMNNNRLLSSSQSNAKDSRDTHYNDLVADGNICLFLNIQICGYPCMYTFFNVFMYICIIVFIYIYIHT
jgi:hypothetical protein